jgi:hypothetical protein
MMETDWQGVDEDARRQGWWFIERLMELQLARWHEVASAAPSEVAVDVTCALSRALSRPADAWDVWHLRDLVETALYRFESADGRALLHRGMGRRHVRRVTERAALVVLVRGGLTLMVFDACYGPFAAVIPLLS